MSDDEDVLGIGHIEDRQVAFLFLSSHFFLKVFSKKKSLMINSNCFLFLGYGRSP